MFKLRHTPPKTPRHRVTTHALLFVHLHQQRGLSKNLEAAAGDEYKRLVAVLRKHGYLDPARYPVLCPPDTEAVSDDAHDEIGNAAYKLITRILAQIKEIHDVWMLIDSPDTYSIWLAVRGIRRNLAEMGFTFAQSPLAA